MTNSKSTPQKHGQESAHYASLGASSSKAGIHNAVGYQTGREFFAEPIPDAAGDPNYFSLLHADGAGTKSIVAYIAYRECGDARLFRSLAQDSLVMNLDDVACVGAFENLVLSNSIGRNRFAVGDDCVQQIVEGYKECVERLRDCGIDILLAGGETADVGDLIRTVIIDSTLFARVKKSGAISFSRVKPGDCIIGLSNTGKASYESHDNSSIGSNGLTLARHALISKTYANKYPEISDPLVEQDKTYRGKHDLFESPAPLTMSISNALLSPTRTYAPVIKTVLDELSTEIHGIVHCSGGGQTKILNFGSGLHYFKDNLFAVPAVFELIQASIEVPWREMYSVFNMGHRMEIICEHNHFNAVRDAAASFNISAQIVGRVEKSSSERNELTISSTQGKFSY